MNRHFRTVVCVLAVLSIGSRLSAQPDMIGWQGYLKDTLGAPIDGLANMKFDLYEDSVGGVAVWTMTKTQVPIDQGIVNVPLGPFDSLNFNIPHWLGVSLNGEAELSPRSPLTSAPSALTLHVPARMEGSYAPGNLDGVLTVVNTAPTGDAVAIRGETAADSGRAVLGVATAATGQNYGVFGESNSTSGRGIGGFANSSSGAGFGALGLTRSPDGAGVHGLATAESGINYGIRASVQSADGYSGYFTGGKGVFVDTTLRAGTVHAATEGVMFPDSTVQVSAVGLGVIAAGTVSFAGSLSTIHRSTGNISIARNDTTLLFEVTIAGVYFDHEDYFTLATMQMAGSSNNLHPYVGSSGGKLVLSNSLDGHSYDGDISFIVFGL